MKLRLLQPSAVVLVFGAALLDGAVAQEPGQPPAPAHVSTRAQIEALPADTKWIVGTGIEDDVVVALLRLRDLERLELRAVIPSPHTPGETVQPMGTLGDAGLQLLTGLQSLRVLELRYQTELTERAFRWLVQLRGLRRLELDWSQIDDRGLAALVRMPGLRELVLTSCANIGKEGLASLATCEELRALDLSLNSTIKEEWLLPMGRMPRLERLNLCLVGARVIGAQGAIDFNGRRLESAVTDRVLEALAASKTLRDLDVSHAPFTARSLALLGRLPLERLVLRGVAVAAEGLAELPPTLKELGLGDHESVTAGCLASLARFEQLRSLKVGRCSAMPSAAVAALLRLRSLRFLDLRGMSGLTADQVAELRALPKLARLATNLGVERLR